MDYPKLRNEAYGPHRLEPGSYEESNVELVPYAYVQSCIVDLHYIMNYMHFVELWMIDEFGVRIYCE